MAASASKEARDEKHRRATACDRATSSALSHARSFHTSARRERLRNASEASYDWGRNNELIVLAWACDPYPAGSKRSDEFTLTILRVHELIAGLNWIGAFDAIEVLLDQLGHTPPEKWSALELPTAKGSWIEQDEQDELRRWATALVEGEQR